MKRVLTIWILLGVWLLAWADGKDDFCSMSSNRPTNYNTRVTPNGWKVTHASTQKPPTCQFYPGYCYVILNGKRSAAGSMSSPLIDGGLSELCFNYAMPCQDWMVQGTLSIYCDGKLAYQTTFGGSLSQYATYEWCKSDFKLDGKIQIVITNNSPTYSSDNADRLALYNFRWKSYVKDSVKYEIASVCEEDLPFIWEHGNNMRCDSTDIYEYHYKDSLGVDTLVYYLLLNVQHRLPDHRDTARIIKGEYYTWPIDGRMYSPEATTEYEVGRRYSYPPYCDSIHYILRIEVDNEKHQTQTIQEDTIVCVYDLPYIWEHGDNMVCDKAGFYNFTLKDDEGYDSIFYYLNLSTQATFDDYHRTVAVASGGSYTWDVTGETYTPLQSETKSVTLKHKVFPYCDSITCYLHMMVNAVFKEEDTLLCVSELPYIWEHGNNMVCDDAGWYTYTYRNQAGIDSITYYLGLSVLYTLPDEEITIHVKPGESYTWEVTGETYSPKGKQDVYHAIKWQERPSCDSITYVLHLILDPVNINEQVLVCEKDLPYVWVNGGNMECGTFGGYDYVEKGYFGQDSIYWHLLLGVQTLSPEQTQTVYLLPGESYTWDVTGETYTPIVSETKTRVLSYTQPPMCDSITLHLKMEVKADMIKQDTTICSDELPFIWQDGGGMSCDHAGCYEYTLKGSLGQDSLLYTLHLNVQEKKTDQRTHVYLQPSQSYQWALTGETFSPTDDEHYERLLYYSLPPYCDSILGILDIEMVPAAYSVIIDTAICVSDVPFVWKEGGMATCYSSGTYNYKIRGSHGLDSIHYTLKLQVQSRVNDNYTSVTLAPGEAYTWSANNWTYHPYVSEDKSVVVPYSKAPHCDSVMCYLHMEVIDPNAKGLPIYMSETASTCPNQSYRWDRDGKSYFITQDTTLTDTIAMPGLERDTIYVLEVSCLPPSHTNQTINVQDSQLPYYWNGIQYNSAGEYHYQTTNHLGCDSIVTLHLNIIGDCEFNPVILPTTTEHKTNP